MFRKTTDSGKCLNASSECPKRYLKGVIRTYVRRALKTCTSWKAVDEELKRVKQILTNNNYSSKDIDQEINRAVGLLVGNKEEKETETNGTVHKLFYKNQYTTAYKEDERVLKNIIRKNVTPTNSADKISLIIYYKSKKTSNMIMKNNTLQESELKANNVVYMYRCPHEGCKLRDTTYVGHTTTSLSRRLTCHLQNGAPRDHARDAHGTKVTRDELVKNTKILTRDTCKHRLQVKEAVIIKELNPILNIQYDFQGVLKLHDSAL